MTKRAFARPGDDPRLPAIGSVLETLRRRKHLCRTGHRELLDDLRQELLLDSLEHTETLSGLDPQARNSRWLRLLERSHYRLRMRDRSFAPSSELASHVTDAAPSDRLGLLLDGADRELLERVATAATHKKNGRLNTTATAGQLGVATREVRATWSRIATRLGYDDEFLRFWRRRLAEALVGLAADLLRDTERVEVYGERRRRRPDPRGRLRRIRTIKHHLSIRPLPPDLKAVLAQFAGPRAGKSVDPRTALDAARKLQPGDTAIHHWRFESAVADGDLRGAAAALWRARHGERDTTRLVLARARLLEARGALRRAEHVLRAAARRRRDPRLGQALAALGASVPATSP